MCVDEFAESICVTVLARYVHAWIIIKSNATVGWRALLLLPGVRACARAVAAILKVLERSLWRRRQAGDGWLL